MDANLIMAQLDRVTASHAFRFADRQRAFLRYVVTEALQNRAERLKEYVIGIEVFGKPASFDPRLDSIVRTEAHKLRAKLSRYFDGEGKTDPIRIELPRGKYSPKFAQSAGATDLLMIGVTATRSRREPESMRLLVLPFEGRNAGTGDQPLSDTLTDELSHALAAIPGIEVVARSCALQFKGNAVDICDVAQRLNVHAVIEGSVQYLGNRVRVLAQVDDTATGCTLWSQSYERRSTKIPGLEQELSQLIAFQLLSKVRPRKTTAPHSSGPEQPTPPDADREAHEHYLRGLRHFARQTPEDMTEASRLFNMAVEKNGRFARGYTHLAYSYLIRPILQAVVPSELVSRASMAASKALELDPLSGAAHVALALERIQNYQWREADEEFRKGLELSPADALGHAWYGIFLASFGRTAEALKEHEEALAIDADAAMSSWSYGLTLFLLRRYGEAARYFRRLLAQHPSSSQAHVGLAMVYLQEGNFGGAIAELERVQSCSSGFGRERAKLGYAYALSGAQDRARDILNEMLAISSHTAVPSQMIAELYIGLGETDNAFRWLHNTIDQSDMPPLLQCDPTFDPLRADPRYERLLKHARML